MPPTRPFFLYIAVSFLLLMAAPSFAAEPPEARGVLNDGKGRFIIDSDTMEALGTEKVIVFKGSVVTKEAFTLCSDELRVSYDEANKIKEIIATGNVRLLQGGRVAKAGRAEYDKLKRSIVFLDSPSISQCGDFVEGKKITYNMDTESAFIEGGKGVRVRAQMGSEKKCEEEKIDEENFCKGTR
jgi:lipopolysaccharide export system protein LptA